MGTDKNHIMIDFVGIKYEFVEFRASCLSGSCTGTKMLTNSKGIDSFPEIYYTEFNLRRRFRPAGF